MSEVSPNPLLRRDKGRMLIGAAIGTGLAANFAMRGGADFLLALNAGRLRSMGEPSISSMIAFNEANSFVMGFAESEILPRANVPVIFGACCFDPRTDLPQLVDTARRSGFAGIANFPTASMLSGSMRQRLEDADLGYDREMELLALARDAGLATLAYSHSVHEAEQAAASSAEMVIIGLGWNQGGAEGAPEDDGTLRAIEEAAIHVDRAARAVGSISKGTLCLVEGGPIVSPRHLEELCGFVNIDGYVGGSTIDRVPIESAIEATTASFKTIGARSTAPDTSDTMQPVFPIQLAGRSETIRRARDQLMRVSESDVAVHIAVPDTAGTRSVAETLHRLSRRRRREAVTICLDGSNSEERRLEIFGHVAGAHPNRDRGRIGVLEAAGGATLILDCVADTSCALIQEVADAVRLGQAKQIGGTRTYPVDLRLILVSGMDMAATPGLVHLPVPRLSDRTEDVSSVLDLVLRDLRARMRRPLLRLDAAAWRRLVDYDWPGDVDELRRSVENAALAGNSDVITPVELGDLKSPDAGRSLFASEKDWILDGLRRNRFNRSETAVYLGISRKTLYNKIRRYALDREGTRT
ncbi:phosphoenolpyruvate hydrolase family protein [Qingshengfaniella alkalisoli]|uniref:Sigma-54 factor interaction domain-containing protein n=1 Tax=Qingshengfaniella alkalisoli TaxID=2599296 RepID=A0A5B8IZR1_9RHOB|nr:phosphoenolpyruvate hydrolase family protein [Qingshengfaniella alkalisoli]QDY71043.1 hypothetical protein FPZ52_15110 [Qingshengfaniella alkalisoli]